jgi:WD40 repeat protein
VTSVAWSPNGLFLASGSADNTVRQWDIEQGQSHVYSGHSDEVLSVAWAADSSFLASGGKDTTVRIWKQTNQSHHSPIAIGAIVNDLAWQHDNSSLFAGTIGNGLCEVFLSLVGTGIAKPMFPGGQVNTRALAISPDGHFLATGNELGIVNLYELSTMNLAFSKRLHQKPVLSLAWSSDGTLLASGAGDKHVQILGVSTTFDLLHTLSHRGAVSSIAWNPGDIRQIATISNDGNLYMWSMPDGKMTTYRNRAGIPTSLTWGVKGLVTGMKDGTIAIWNHLGQPGSPQ